MELEQNTVDSRHNSELVDSKQSVNTDNPVDTTQSDKEQSEEDNMKRDIVLRTGGSPMDISDEQSKQKLANQNGPVCERTSNQEDSSREDSSSDYSENEESYQCQLTNQALRAKLINSVINPISDRDSKLRVSVFDHRIIPKKFIIPVKSGDCRNPVDTSDNDHVKTLTQTKSQDNINELNCSNNRRKVSTLPYTVLTANRRRSNNKDSNGESNCTSENGSKNRDSNCSENGSKMDSDFEIRTRFDILLRNLIGDVDSINVQPSPMTVSSGYESDYIQTHNTHHGAQVNVRNECNNTNISGNTGNNVTVKSEDTPTDYFTMSETYPQTQVIETTGATQNQQFSSLPAFPTQYMDNNTGPVNTMEPTDVQKSKTNTSKQSDSDFGFFYKQKKNYKLTKVTRSMYEIIHDLQNGEKGQSDGKKRSKKGRRPGQDSGSDGTNSPKDTLTRGRPQVGDDKSDNNTDNSTLKRTKETNNSCVSGSVVRCVRRPQLADSVPRPVHRRFSQSENEGRLGPVGAINSDKVQNDLRNLLCDTSDVTASSASINDRLEGFNMLSSSPNTQDGCATGLTSTADNGGNHSRVSINGEENRLTEGKRKPTLNEKQINNSPKHDDHVYETIPGDEKFYEEWKKMRTTMPCIRRFTTIPDLPGTFIPKEPPALPARRYLNNANQGNVSKKRELSDSNDNYIIMGDINSNFPIPDKSDSGYTTVSSDQMLVLREPQCFPYPIGNTSPSDNFGRHDETSDGYCSIDNLSLLREPVDPSAVTPFSSNERTRDWRVPEPGSVPPPPRLKRSDFFVNPNQKQFIQNGFSLFNHEHSTEMVPSPEVLDRRRSRDALEDINCMSSGFDKRTTKQSYQATYV